MKRTTEVLTALVVTAAIGVTLGAAPASAAGGSAVVAPAGLDGCCGL